MSYDWSQNKYGNSPWRLQVVANTLPILIRRAKEGRTITYSELAESLLADFGHEPKARKTLYGPVVGAVGMAIRELGERWQEVIPAINTIVVRADTGLPSSGADEFAHYFFKASGQIMDADRPAYMRAAMDAVFTYRDWDRVAQALGTTTLLPATGKIDSGDVIDLPSIPDAMAGESPEHDALKRWVAANPEVVEDFGDFAPGQFEKSISSGDRLDAFFDNGRARLAVEVKTSHASDDEMHRGVYQCIKYRAVLRAEQLALSQVPNGEAVLASPQRPSPKVRALMKRLHVSFVLVPKSAEAVATTRAT